MAIDPDSTRFALVISKMPLWSELRYQSQVKNSRPR